MVTGPVSAPAGTTACSDFAVTPSASPARRPANVTPVAPARFVPVIVTVVPTGPAAGRERRRPRRLQHRQLRRAQRRPSTVVTLIFPVTAPSGTVNCSCVAVLELSSPGGTVVPPTFTVGAPVAARRFVPVTSMIVVLPPTALPGVKLVIFGAP